MNMYQFNYFITLAECLSYTQAAAALYVAQPALSRAISSMEEEMGIQLFERNKRSVRLTPAGQAFHKEAVKILKAYNDALLYSKMAERGEIGRLKLGYRFDTVNSFVPRLARRFNETRPNIVLEMGEYKLSEIGEAYESGELDFIIGSSRDVNPDGTDEFMIWGLEPQYIVVPWGHRLAGAKSVSLRELKDEPFILLNRRATPQAEMFVQSCMAAGFKPREVGDSFSVPDIVMRVAGRMGITALQQTSAELARGIASIIPLKDMPPVQRAIIWKKKSKNPCVPRMVETVKAVIKEIEDENNQNKNV